MTTHPNTDPALAALAALVDREGIADVLGLLAQVCVGKAEQGAPRPECWMELAGHLDVATDYAMDEIVVYDPDSEGFDDDET